MSSANAPPLRPCGPRLSYRNPSPQPPSQGEAELGEASSSASQATGSLSHSTASTSDLSRNSRPSYTSALSQSSTRTLSHTPSRNEKRKGSSIFGGFFTVKEPSAQAFADFHKEAARKAAAQSKDGRIPKSVIPGVSNTKLPPTVPKVNTKWDGVPKALKEKEKEASRRASMECGSRNSVMPGLVGLKKTTLHHSSSSVASNGSLTRSRTPGSSNSSRSRLALNDGLSKPTNGAASFVGAGAPHLQPRSTPSAPQSFVSESTNSLPDFASAFSAGTTGTGGGDSSTRGFNALASPTVVTPLDSPLTDVHPVIAPSTPQSTVSSFYTAYGSTHDDLQKTSHSSYQPGDDFVIVKPATGRMLLPPVVAVNKKPRVKPFPAGEAQPLRTPPEGYRASSNPFQPQSHETTAAVATAATTDTTIRTITAARPTADSYFAGAIPVSNPPTSTGVPSQVSRRASNIPAPLDLTRSTSTRMSRPTEPMPPSQQPSQLRRDRSVTPWDFTENPAGAESRPTSSRPDTSQSMLTPTTPTSTKSVFRRTKLWHFNK